MLSIEFLRNFLRVGKNRMLDARNFLPVRNGGKNLASRGDKKSASPAIPHTRMV